jgi:hypothetical protein
MTPQLLESWSSFYSNHAALRTAVDFIHVGGLVAGGGGAISADLASITAARQDGVMARATQLQLLKRTHRIAVLGLAALFASGVLLFAADVGTYLYSRIFWVKMGLIVMLLVNGSALLRIERAAARGDRRAWRRLHVAAIVSLVLWGLTTLAGAALPNIG